MKFRINGADVLTKSNASGSVAASQTATLNVLNGGGGSFIGNACEIIHVARYDATDLAAVESYLKAKWGTP
jgi:hypothetical protein